MTDIIARLKEDLLKARKDAKVRERNLLSTVVGDLQSNAKLVNGVKVVTDEEALKILKKFIKNMDENIANGPNGAVKYEAQVEKDILIKYVPQQFSEEKIKTIISEECEELDFKATMAYFKAVYPNLYDGKILSKIVKERFDGKAKGQ